MSKEEIQNLASKIEKLESKIDDLHALAGPNATYLGNNQLLTQTLHGTKYIIYADDLISTPNMVVYRQWEAELSSLMYKFLNKDSFFIDVGANFGYFTCLAGAIIGGSGEGRVLSVEPNPRMLELIRKNVRINWGMSSIDIIEGALDKERRSVQMAFPVQLSANATLADVDWQGDEVVRTEIDCFVLDDLLSDDERRKVDFIKIDVEGFEYNVLQGMHKLINLNKNIKVVFEWSASQLKDAKVNIDEFLAFLKENFEYVYLLENGLTAIKFEDLEGEYYKEIVLANSPL